MIRMPAIRMPLRWRVATAACAALFATGCHGSPPPDKPVAEDASDDQQEDSESVSPHQDDPPLMNPSGQLDPDVDAQDTPTTSEEFVAPKRNRLGDTRPDINELRLQECGIIRIESRRLRLLTDLPQKQVAHLPALADKLFDHLSAYFGKLPPAADGSEFQVTGHIIADESKFTAAGLLPETHMGFAHGRHFNYEFWMYGQKTDYFQEHLMLHEFTHCFMTCESGMRDIPPLWYIEGMAEYFATHSVQDGRTQFGVLPDTVDDFEGWGRIAELKRSFWEQQRQPLAEDSGAITTMLTISPLDDVIPTRVLEFESNYQYASTWAVCWLMEQNLEYRQLSEQFRLVRRRQPFLRIQQSIDSSLMHRFRTDWLLVVESLIEGFDTAHSFPIHHSEPWTLAAAPVELELRADRGWFDSGLRLKANESVTVTCEGRIRLNRLAKPWESEPQGVSIEYHEQLPLGCVVGILIGKEGDTISGRISIGRGRTIEVSQDCSLWLQVNESESERADNSGSIQVTLTAK